MLNHQLMMFLASEPLWESQISTQTTIMSNLGDVLIIYSFDTNIIFLNKYTSLSTPLTISRVMIPSFIIYGSLSIFKYNLDFGRQGLLIKSELILLILLIYFLTVVKSEGLASLFIVMLTSSFITQIKSAIMSDLIFFRHLLILAMC